MSRALNWLTVALVALGLVLLIAGVAQAQFMEVASGTGTSTTFIDRRATVHMVCYRTTGTEGTVVLKDAATGPQRFTIHTPAAEGFDCVNIPLGGILFRSGVSATLTNVDGLSIFYE